MKSRAMIPLILGLIVGVVAVKLFVDVLKKAKGATPETVQVVRAKMDIGPTVEIKETMVEVVNVAKPLAPEGAFHSIEELTGRVCAQTIAKGTPVVPSLLAPKGTPPGMAVRIKEGYRAVAVQIDEFVGVAGWIKPGTRVDVVAVMTGRQDGENETVSRVILQNVEVLAVGQDIGTSGDPTAAVAKSVTLLVKPEEATKLHLVSTKGKVRLAMRNQQDNDVAGQVVTSDKDIIGSSKTQNGGAVLSSNLSLLNKFMAEQAKVARKPTDKETNKVAQPSPELLAVNKPREWTVEVVNGGEVSQVRFDGETRHARRITEEQKGSGQPRATAAKPAPAARPFNSVFSRQSAAANQPAEDNADNK